MICSCANGDSFGVIEILGGCNETNCAHSAVSLAEVAFKATILTSQVGVAVGFILSVERTVVGVAPEFVEVFGRGRLAIFVDELFAASMHVLRQQVQVIVEMLSVYASISMSVTGI